MSVRIKISEDGYKALNDVFNNQKEFGPFVKSPDPNDLIQALKLMEKGKENGSSKFTKPILFNIIKALLIQQKWADKVEGEIENVVDETNTEESSEDDGNDVLENENVRDENDRKDLKNDFYSISRMASLRTADDALQEVNDNIMKLKEIDIRKSNQVLDWLKNDVVDAMKKNDALFNSLFREIYYSGSYYDGLKIKEPDEFDLNIVLDTRKFEDNLTLVDASPGYCRMQISELLIKNSFRIDVLVKNTWNEWWTSNYFLRPNKVREWFAGVFQRSICKFPKRIADGSMIRIIGTEQNGPAFTIKLEVTGNAYFKVDIDLAVVFPYDPINFEQDPEIRKNLRLRHLKSDLQTFPCF